MGLEKMINKKAPNNFPAIKINLDLYGDKQKLGVGKFTLERYPRVLILDSAGNVVEVKGWVTIQELYNNMNIALNE